MHGELLSGLNEQIALVTLAYSLDDPESVEEVISEYRGRLAGCFDCELEWRIVSIRAAYCEPEVSNGGYLSPKDLWGPTLESISIL